MQDLTSKCQEEKKQSALWAKTWYIDCSNPRHLIKDENRARYSLLAPEEKAAYEEELHIAKELRDAQRALDKEMDDIGVEWTYVIAIIITSLSSIPWLWYFVLRTE